MKPIILVFLLARLATAKLGQKQAKTNNWEEKKYHRLNRKLAGSTPTPPIGDENSSRQEPLTFPGTRIVGGTQTAQGKYPWFVNWAGSCGASLIHEDIILSAAHCNEITSNSVRVGSWKLTSNSGVQQKTIVSRRQHPNYNPNTFAYDFVVMKLNSAVTGGVKPVSINGVASNPTSGESLRLIGHGTTRSGGSPSNVLLEADVNSIPFNRCNPAYASNGFPLNDAVMFCAGVTGGGKDSCQGDSGGPIFEYNNGSPVQVGVVSWGFGCASADFPGVYARTSGVKSWIDQQICELSSNPPASCGNGSGGGTQPSGAVEVRVQIRTDRYPEEISWAVFDANSKLVTYNPPGYIPSAGAFTYALSLQPGQTYRFEIYDERADGICCGYGTGSFNAKAIINGASVSLIPVTRGNYGYGFGQNFVVPTSSRRATTTLTAQLSGPTNSTQVEPRPAKIPPQPTSPP